MKNKMTKQQYNEYVKQKTPNSAVGKNCLMAFLFGGAICAVGQGIYEFYARFNITQEQALTATSVTLVFSGALLTGLDLYNKMAKYAGAGTIVPITGFANAMVSPALESKTEGLVLGVGAKMFTIAGPVIVYGTVASVIAGIVYFVMSIK
ncbi:MAG: stage V sporulation protein AC [Clostridia bacterium]|nr:stage V sporulation protein AC [Clostridia bacterium]